MYQVSQILITKQRYPELYNYLELNAKLAKNLYNASLFRIRQNFTSKGKENLSTTQEEVKQELELLKQTCNKKIGAVLSYGVLEKLMRVTNNPDFFAGLPMQTAQAVVKQSYTSFKSWLANLKEYKKDSSNYTGKPRMPKYIKADKITYTISNQDAVLYHTEDGCYLKLPKTKETVNCSHVSFDAVLKEVKVKPFYDNYLIVLTMETRETVVSADMPYKAGLDFGVSNTVALVSNNGLSLLYRGSVIKSHNQFFNKEKARLVSILTKGHETKTKPCSHWLDRLSLHRSLFMKDIMHKISSDIIKQCVEHKIGTLVFGVNKGWKQELNLGSVTNQNFASIPNNMLRFMITYKAERVGIIVIDQEESYTSKASFLDNDFIPVYGRENGIPMFSGKRTTRGLYKAKDGLILNADINAGANILRKAVSDAFDKVVNFAYLFNPKVITFAELN